MVSVKLAKVHPFVLLIASLDSAATPSVTQVKHTSPVQIARMIIVVIVYVIISNILEPALLIAKQILFCVPMASVIQQNPVSFVVQIVICPLVEMEFVRTLNTMETVQPTAPPPVVLIWFVILPRTQSPVLLNALAILVVMVYVTTTNITESVLRIARSIYSVEIPSVMNLKM